MILVTGGTGLVGSHLLYHLLRKDEQIRAIHRSTSDLEKVHKIFTYYTSEAEAEVLFRKIEWVKADIVNIPSLEKVFEGIQTVYHCAALISFDPKDENKLRKINIEGTANIVNHCIAFQVKKLCFVSSIASIGEPVKKDVIDEKCAWNPEKPHSDYAISKYGAEIEVWRASQEGVQVIIVNPGVIIGPGFWNSGSGKLFSRVADGLKYHFPKVTGFVGVNDVVKGMIRLMDAELKNEQYIQVSENLSFESVLKMVARELEKPEPDVQLKKWMIFMGWIFQKIGGWFGVKREITFSSIKSLYHENNFSSKKIKNELDYDFEGIESVISSTAEIYRKEEKA